MINDGIAGSGILQKQLGSTMLDSEKALDSICESSEFLSIKTIKLVFESILVFGNSQHNDQTAKIVSPAMPASHRPSSSSH
jgi:hypothetical protein